MMPVSKMFWGARYGKLKDPYGRGRRPTGSTSSDSALMRYIRHCVTVGTYAWPPVMADVSPDTIPENDGTGC